MTAIDTDHLGMSFQRRGARLRLWKRFLTRPPVTKRDSEVIALKGLNLSVDPGECYGLLGPNGAGKTTTVRLLSTLLIPTSGAAKVCGHDVEKHAREVRRSIGLMLTGERGLYWRLTGRENLELFGHLQYMPATLRRQRVDAMLSQFELSRRSDDLVETYSSGMKQRLNLARVLLHDPPVLILDEPTASLDPAIAQATRHRIMELRNAGKAILLATHNMHEAQEVCDRVGILHMGELIAEGTPEQLTQLAGIEPRLEVSMSGDLSAAKTAVRGSIIWWIADSGANEGKASLAAPSGWESARRLTEMLLVAGVVVRESKIRGPTLEDAFIKLTGSQLSQPTSSFLSE